MRTCIIGRSWTISLVSKFSHRPILRNSWLSHCLYPNCLTDPAALNLDGSTLLGNSSSNLSYTTVILITNARCHSTLLVAKKLYSPPKFLHLGSDRPIIFRYGIKCDRARVKIRRVNLELIGQVHHCWLDTLLRKSDKLLPRRDLFQSYLATLLLLTFLTPPKRDRKSNRS